VVRHRGRGCGQALHVPDPELEDQPRHALRLGRPTRGRNGHDGRLRAERQRFVALNGGPEYKFTEAVSFVINCETQDEVDELWEKLSEGGEKGPCGWLKDRYGLSWQIVPTILMELIGDSDEEKSQRVMAAMMQMGKLEIEPLQRAAAGEKATSRA
jgi:uncharacterized glyoxalase superfamily protein PhnB